MRVVVGGEELNANHMVTQVKLTLFANTFFIIFILTFNFIWYFFIYLVSISHSLFLSLTNALLSLLLRELAMQSHQVVVDVGGLKSVCIYGGVPKPQQKSDLRAGAEVNHQTSTEKDFFNLSLTLYHSLFLSLFLSTSTSTSHS